MGGALIYATHAQDCPWLLQTGALSSSNTFYRLAVAVAGGRGGRDRNVNSLVAARQIPVSQQEHRSYESTHNSQSIKKSTELMC